MSRIEHPCKILYGAATGLERALVDVGGGRIIDIPAERIRDMWDPWKISPENLPTLAWALGAQMWDPDWSDSTKRQWLVVQWQYQAQRGTRAGIEMALRTMGRDFTGGYDLLDVLAAPEGFYASPNLPKEQWDAWIRQMPELRIQLARRTGKADGGWHVLDAFVGTGYVGHDDGSQLYGRQAILRRQGQPDQDIGLVQAGDDGANRLSIPGAVGRAFVAGQAFVSDDRFVDGDAISPDIYSFSVNGAYNHDTSDLHLSTIAPGLVPIDVQYERESDVGEAGPFFFVGDFVHDHFVGDGAEAADMLADRIYLYDPRVATPMTLGISYVGINRVDYPPYNAETLIDLKTRETGPAWIIDNACAGAGFAVPDDWADFDRALRAIAGPGGGKALRDKVMADFEATHPLRCGEPIYADPDTLFGDQRRGWL